MSPATISVTIAILSSSVSLFVCFYTQWSGRKSAERQIQNARDLSLVEFKKTLNSKNRQDWVIELRHCLGELFTYTKLLNIEFSSDQKNAQKLLELNEKVTYNQAKIFLLLTPQNPNKPLHKELFEAINSLLKILDIQTNEKSAKTESETAQLLRLSNEVINTGRKVLYDEWQKIQEMKS